MTRSLRLLAAAVPLFVGGCAMNSAPAVPLGPVMTGAEPIEVARVLAATYPMADGISYVHALSWTGRIRLSQLSGEGEWADDVVAEVMPFVDNPAPLYAQPMVLTNLAGGVGIWEVATRLRNDGAIELTEAIADTIVGPGDDDSAVRFRTGWSDDMFMVPSFMARVSAVTGADKYMNAVSEVLLDSIDRLQREDGLFAHSEENGVAWARGNGFAAMGMAETLTYMPPVWDDRIQVLQTYNEFMATLAALQSEDGSWHQVLDVPTSFNELTSTAMITMAMARGVRMGWLDDDRYLPVIDAAWGAIASRIAEDGTVRDACASTAAGPDLNYYLNRPQINGFDDRSGGVVLLAAVEVQALRGMGGAARPAAMSAGGSASVAD